jgi:hypothetical protein
MYKYIVGVWNIAEDDNEVVTANTLDLPKGESMNMEVQILLNSGQEASLVGTTLSFRLVDYVQYIDHAGGSSGSSKPRHQSPCLHRSRYLLLGHVDRKRGAPVSGKAPRCLPSEQYLPNLRQLR